ncbi:hypothetical protein K490DRAFT_34981 [Saccharata proteae CBS 121410]|uniref:BHLH domain-containing protein n=1 Tax=Saccharata proteae CBS 121410 TaxID=1314787 RepID=A0A9P4HW37_9PEZI|nr:hypothetical protein K490DRAFT_34981 [Saccharata proteae CBS 121410]
MRPEGTPAQSDGDETSDEDLSPGAKPSKRRKTLDDGDRGRTGSEASTSAHRNSSFSATRGKKRRPSIAETTPRKRSATAAQKAQRENLTEEQKRNNHILSEQKRRNLIKQGFEEMNELVPGLKSGGFSKSSVLMEGAKFLETLVRGNEILRQALGEV